MRRNRKTKDLPNAHANDQRLESELILLSKRQVDSRSDRRRSHGEGGYPALGCFPARPATVGEQLITQLADLDLTADVRMSDAVDVSLQLPLWQVIELSMMGDFNANLVALLNASLDNRAGDPAYLARLNAIILEAAQKEQ